MPSTHIRDLPYREDSAVLMRALSEFEMPAFLDSAMHGGSNARHDILAAAPIAYFTLQSGKISCSKNLQGLISDAPEAQDLLNTIRQLKAKYLPGSTQDASASMREANCGAIMAYLGYPALHGKSKLCIEDAFAGVYAWTLVVNHESRRCSLRFHSSCSADYIAKTYAALSEAVARQASHTPGEYLLESRFEPLSSYSDYERAFAAIKSHIECGDCYQVNLTQCFEAHGRGHALDAYLQLRQATAAPFSAYFNWGDGALLSLSPERFLKLRGKRVLTQPIKGTRPRGATPEQDAALAEELTRSEKDTAENLMIVDLLRNDLGRVCDTGSIKANQLFTIESYSNVHHMVSDVAGTLAEGLDAMDLLNSCYPGGSITGAPKLSAMHIIQQQEQASRRAYCGTAFCWGAEGDFDSSITIRTLLWEANALRCWAGGGIVADSDCAQEYQECFDKIGNIFKALQG